LEKLTNFGAHPATGAGINNLYQILGNREPVILKNEGSEIPSADRRVSPKPEILKGRAFMERRGPLGRG
jgi:hypothetical protein